MSEKTPSNPKEKKPKKPEPYLKPYLPEDEGGFAKAPAEKILTLFKEKSRLTEQELVRLLEQAKKEGLRFENSSRERTPAEWVNESEYHSLGVRMDADGGLELIPTPWTRHDGDPERVEIIILSVFSSPEEKQIARAYAEHVIEVTPDK